MVTQDSHGSTIQKRTWMLLAVGVLSVLFSFAFHNSASAYVTGDCKFSGSNPSIKFKFNSVGSHYQSISYYAAVRWNNTSSPGSFSSTTSSTRNIDIYDAYYAWTHRAVTEGGLYHSGSWP
jgi:hypothetical protein